MKHYKLKSKYDDLTLGVLVEEPECLSDNDGIVETGGETPKGIVQLVHGMCEHKERYEPFMEYLASKGFVVVIHDHRGHGESVKSPDDLGYMYDGGWEAMVDDVKTVGEWADASYPGLKRHLIGHSMGSMVVRSYTKRYPETIASLVVCGSPSANAAAPVAKQMAAAFGRLKGWHHRPQLLQQLSFGAFNKPYADEGFASAWVCSDRNVLQAYHNDPLCQFQFTANGFYNLMCLMMDCYSKDGWKLSCPRLPIFFISGAEDPCRTSDAKFYQAVNLMKEVGYKDVSSKLYLTMRHEILNETDHQKVFDDIFRWLIETDQKVNRCH